MKIRKYAKANLENKRKLFFEIGFIVALLIVLGAFEYRSYEAGDALYEFSGTEVEIEELPPVTVHEPPPPVVKPPVFRNLNITLNEESDNFDDIPDVLINEDDEVDWEPAVKFETEEVLPEDPVYILPSELAVFPGGMTALTKYLIDNTVYPEMAKEMNIQGTVYVGFIVEKDGSVSNVKVLREIGYGLDEEAIKVVSSMPKWIPAKQNGRKVRLSMTLPVKFRLVAY